MPQARDEAGNIWETDAQGNPVALVQAAGASQGRVFSLPQNPKDVLAEARQASKDAIDASDKASDNARADRAEARAEREWSAKFFPDGTPRPTAVPLTKQQQGAARLKLQGIEAIANQVARVEAALEKAERDGFVGPIYGNIPFSGSLDAESSVLDKSIAQLAPLIRQLTRVPGEGAMSDYESRLASMALPSRSDNPAALRESLGGIRDLLTQSRLGYAEMLGELSDSQGQQAEDEIDKVAAVPENAPPGLPPAGQGGNDPNIGPQTIARGDFRFVDNPRARSTIASLINAGAGYSTVAAAAKEAGGRPPSIQEFNAVKAWMKANPDKEYPASSVEAGEYQPLTMLQKAAGSPLGAGVASYANAATAGTASALAGERGKGALDAMEAANPGAALTGNILGGITGALGAEAALAARAPAALARFAPRIADAAYGGLFGFNEADEGKGLQGAATGAIAGAAGGFIGDRAMRAVGSTARGIVDPAVQRLREAGIPLTVGRAVGNSGALGSGIKKLEEAATSLPGVGSVIGARFDDGLQGLNRAAFEVGAETTGGQVQDVGSAGLGQLRQLVGQTYDNALNPGVRLDVTDPAVAQDLINAQMAASAIPQVGGRAVDAIDYRITGGTGIDGTMDGRDFQEAYRGLGRDGRAAARGDDLYAQEFAGATGQAQDALATGLEAQNPGAYAGFVDANTANRRAMVLADAVNAAKNQPDELFTPAQLNAADANSATRLTGRMNSASGNRPFHQLAQDAQQIMGNRLPNSGTADRAWTGLALGGALGGGAGYVGGDTGTGAATGLGATLALMLGGSRPAQRAITQALFDRPAWLRDAGDMIARNSQIGGWSGAGVLTPLLVGPQ